MLPKLQTSDLKLYTPLLNDSGLIHSWYVSTQIVGLSKLLLEDQQESALFQIHILLILQDRNQIL